MPNHSEEAEDTIAPPKRKKTRPIIRDDNDEEKESPALVEVGKVTDDRETTSAICASCKQARNTKLWGLVSPHFRDTHPHETAKWTCNYSRDKNDKTNYCMFVQCTNQSHRELAVSKNNLALIWRFCGDGHKSRSNWLNLVRDTNDEADHHRATRSILDSTDTNEIQPGWERDWDCSDPHERALYLCGLSNEQDMTCSSCQKVRRISRWPSAMACNDYNSAGHPVLSAAYEDENGESATWKCGTRLIQHKSASHYATVAVESSYAQHSEMGIQTRRTSGKKQTDISFCNFVQCSKCAQFRVLDERSTWYEMVHEIVTQHLTDGEDPSSVDETIHQSSMVTEGRWTCPKYTCYLRYHGGNVDEVDFFLLDEEDEPRTTDKKRHRTPCARCKSETFLVSAETELLAKRGLTYTCALARKKCDDSKARVTHLSDADADGTIAESEEIIDEEEMESYSEHTQRDENLFYTKNIVKRRDQGSPPVWDAKWSNGVRTAASNLVTKFDKTITSDGNFAAFCFWHILHTTVEFWMEEAYQSHASQKGETLPAQLSSWLYLPPSLIITKREEEETKEQREGEEGEEGGEEGEEKGEEEEGEEEEGEGEEGGGMSVDDVLFTEMCIRKVIESAANKKASDMIGIFRLLQTRELFELTLADDETIDEMLDEMNTQARERASLRSGKKANKHEDAIHRFIVWTYGEDMERGKSAAAYLKEVSEYYDLDVTFKDVSAGGFHEAEYFLNLARGAVLGIEHEEEDSESEDREDIEEDPKTTVTSKGIDPDLVENLVTFIVGSSAGSMLSELFKESEDYSKEFTAINERNEITVLMELYDDLVVAELKVTKLEDKADDELAFIVEVCTRMILKSIALRDAARTLRLLSYIKQKGFLDLLDRQLDTQLLQAELDKRTKERMKSAPADQHTYTHEDAIKSFLTWADKKKSEENADRKDAASHLKKVSELYDLESMFPVIKAGDPAESEYLMNVAWGCVLGLGEDDNEASTISDRASRRLGREITKFIAGAGSGYMIYRLFVDTESYTERFSTLSDKINDTVKEVAILGTYERMIEAAMQKGTAEVTEAQSALELGKSKSDAARAKINKNGEWNALNAPKPAHQTPLGTSETDEALAKVRESKKQHTDTEVVSLLTTKASLHKKARDLAGEARQEFIKAETERTKAIWKIDYEIRRILDKSGTIESSVDLDKSIIEKEEDIALQWRTDKDEDIEADKARYQGHINIDDLTMKRLKSQLEKRAELHEKAISMKKSIEAKKDELRTLTVLLQSKRRKSLNADIITYRDKLKAKYKKLKERYKKFITEEVASKLDEVLNERESIGYTNARVGAEKALTWVRSLFEDAKIKENLGKWKNNAIDILDPGLEHHEKWIAMMLARDFIAASRVRFITGTRMAVSGDRLVRHQGSASPSRFVEGSLKRWNRATEEELRSIRYSLWHYEIAPEINTLFDSHRVFVYYIDRSLALIEQYAKHMCIKDKKIGGEKTKRILGSIRRGYREFNYKGRLAQDADKMIEDVSSNLKAVNIVVPSWWSRNYSDESKAHKEEQLDILRNVAAAAQKHLDVNVHARKFGTGEWFNIIKDLKNLYDNTRGQPSAVIDSVMAWCFRSELNYTEDEFERDIHSLLMAHVVAVPQLVNITRTLRQVDALQQRVNATSKRKREDNANADYLADLQYTSATDAKFGILEGEKLIKLSNIALEEQESIDLNASAMRMKQSAIITYMDLCIQSARVSEKIRKEIMGEKRKLARIQKNQGDSKSKYNDTKNVVETVAKLTRPRHPFPLNVSYRDEMNAPGWLTKSSIDTLNVMISMYKEIRKKEPAPQVDLADKDQWFYMKTNHMVTELIERGLDEESKSEQDTMSRMEGNVRSLLLFGGQNMQGVKKDIVVDRGIRVLRTRYIMRNYGPAKARHVPPRFTIEPASVPNPFARTRIVRYITDLVKGEAERREEVEAEEVEAEEVEAERSEEVEAEEVEAEEVDATEAERSEEVEEAAADEKIRGLMNKIYRAPDKPDVNTNPKFVSSLEMLEDILYRLAISTKEEDAEIDKLCIYLYKHSGDTEWSQEERDLISSDSAALKKEKHEYIQQLCSGITSFVGGNRTLDPLLKAHYDADAATAQFGGPKKEGGQKEETKKLTKAEKDRKDLMDKQAALLAKKFFKNPATGQSSSVPSAPVGKRDQEPRQEDQPAPRFDQSVKQIQSAQLEKEYIDDKKKWYKEHLLPRIITALQVVSHMVGVSESFVYEAIRPVIAKNIASLGPVIPKKMENDKRPSNPSKPWKGTLMPYEPPRSSFGVEGHMRLTNEEMDYFFKKLAPVGKYYCVGPVGWSGSAMSPNIGYDSVPFNHPSGSSIIVTKAATSFLNNLGAMANVHDVVTIRARKRKSKSDESKPDKNDRVLHVGKLSALRAQLLKARPSLAIASVRMLLFFRADRKLGATEPRDLFTITNYTLTPVDLTKKREGPEDPIHENEKQDASFGSRRAIASFV